MRGLLKRGEYEDDEAMESQSDENAETMPEDEAAAAPGDMPTEEPGADMAEGEDPQAAATGEEQPNVSPEEQKAYEQFVNNAFNLIYDQKAMPMVLQRLKTSNPVDALAATTVMIVDRLEDSAKKSNAPVAPEILFHGGKAILEDLASLSKDAQIHDYSDQELEQALYRAMDIYREMKTKEGTLNQDAAKADLEQIMQMDQSGELEQMFPDAREHFGEAQEGQPPEEEAAGDAPRGLLRKG